MHMASRHKQLKPKTPPRWRTTFLRQWREHSHRTLEEVAAKMGITHGQLSKIERGLSPYSQRILEVAAQEYGCTVQDLLTRPPGEAPDIFGLWGKLDETKKELAVRLLGALDDE